MGERNRESWMMQAFPRIHVSYTDMLRDPILVRPRVAGTPKHEFTFVPLSPDYSDAACANLPQDQMDWFFDEAHTMSALKLCSTCPVLRACRSLNMGERYGVWGGTTAVERQSIRKWRRP